MKRSLHIVQIPNQTTLRKGTLLGQPTPFASTGNYHLSCRCTRGKPHLTKNMQKSIQNMIARPKHWQAIVMHMVRTFSLNSSCNIACVCCPAVISGVWRLAK
jgi:hypothetical protein